MKENRLNIKKLFAVKSAVALLLVMGMMSAFGTLSLRADDADKGGDEAGSERRHMDWKKEGEDHWKKKLGLTDDQAKKLDGIRESERADMEPLRDKLHVLSEKLRWQVDSKASDKEIKTTLDEMSATHASLQSSEQKYRNQRNGVLTPTQQAKSWLAMMGHREHGMFKGHMRDGGMRKEHPEPEDKDE